MGKEGFVVGFLCVGFIVLNALPVVFRCPPLPSAFFGENPDLQEPGCLFLTLVIAGLILIVAHLDREERPWKAVRFTGFVLFAALLTDIHAHTVDLFHLDWQWEQYKGVLRHTYQPPDQYRFLSQGTLWWLLLSNGSFIFSYLAYRFFFTFLLCQAIYKFARLYIDPLQAMLVVLLYAAFYPLSTRYYYGNLCDPTSHAVMLIALIYCQRRKFWPVFWLLVLGTFIKETMLLIAPCWLLLDSETPPHRNYRGLLRVAALLFAGIAVFAACRLPFHFNYDFKTLNRTEELMIWSNLGLARARFGSTIPLYWRYLHPVLFLFMWLPVIVWRRKLLPPTLFRTAVYLSAAFYLTNLCFGWNHESRNFVPGLVVLLVCTAVVLVPLVPLTARTE